MGVGNGKSAGDPYLIFRVRREEFIIPAAHVHEIRALPSLEAPARDGVFRGSIDIHGRVVPVLDLNARLSGVPAKQTGRQFVIVLPMADPAGRRGLVGLLVDAVSSVIQIPADKLNRETVLEDLRTGRVRIHGRFKYLLDVDRILRPCDAEATIGFIPIVA